MAYIRKIDKSDDKQVREHWSLPHDPLPEYSLASATICLAPEWRARTKLGRCLKCIDDTFERDPALRQVWRDRSHFEGVLLRTIQKAYGLQSTSAARRQQTVPCGHDSVRRKIFDTIILFCFEGPPSHLLGGGKLLVSVECVSWALQALLELETPDAIVTAFLEICDRVPRCQTAHLQAYNLLICHGFRVKEKAVALCHGGSRSFPGSSCSSDLDCREVARAKVTQCFEDFLDDHKRQAFTSAFIAPARYYLYQIGAERAAVDMDLHGVNWYLALINSTLNMQMPMVPFYDDPISENSGVVDFWEGLDEGAWEFFSSVDNFGKYLSGMPNLPMLKYLKSLVDLNHLPHGCNPGRKAKHLGNIAVEMDPKKKSRRQRLATYLERFAYFFRAGFFVRKAFETMNSETKPEHVGFRQAAETLYTFYRTEKLEAGGEDTLMEHCYKDEYYMELDVPRVKQFFRWLGIGVANTPEYEDLLRKIQPDADADAAIMLKASREAAVQNLLSDYRQAMAAKKKAATVKVVAWQSEAVSVTAMRAVPVVEAAATEASAMEGRMDMEPAWNHGDREAFQPAAAFDRSREAPITHEGFINEGFEGDGHYRDSRHGGIGAFNENAARRFSALTRGKEGARWRKLYKKKAFKGVHEEQLRVTSRQVQLDFAEFDAPQYDGVEQATNGFFRLQFQRPFEMQSGLGEVIEKQVQHSRRAAVSFRRLEHFFDTQRDLREAIEKQVQYSRHRQVVVEQRWRC
mmetsp:Transcript_116063/g.237363  ORF Transcript_116063/g.237363 Transcript_116063/m.237363 type:complete len:744 (-) Transcript_116063:165-2396(-)